VVYVGFFSVFNYTWSYAVGVFFISFDLALLMMMRLPGWQGIREGAPIYGQCASISLLLFTFIASYGWLQIYRVRNIDVR